MTLKELRKRAGLSQKQAGELLGISGSEVSLHEKKMRAPRLPLILKYAEIYHCTVEDIVLAVKTV